MGFYRIIKKTIRFILYQLPKKWLIMIIFALAMTFGLTQVKAIDYNSSNWLQYTVASSGNVWRFSADVPFYVAPDRSNSNYLSCYGMNTNDYIYVNVYKNGSLLYNYIGSAQIMSYGSNPQYTNISGFGNVALYYPTDTLLFSNSPKITTTESSIKNWSFQTLNIDGGYLLARNSYGNNNFVLHSNYMENEQLIDLSSNYITVNQDNTVSFSVPKNLLVTSAAIANGRTISFELWYYESVEGGRNITPIDLGSYTLASISTANQNAGNTDAQLTAIQDVNTSINETNNFLQDTNVNSSDIFQPSVPQDTSGVETGVNNIFTAIMNAFINLDTTQSVVLPVPFTNKNITIPGTYTRDMLTSVNATWLLTFINLIWWYLISRYIVKDILKIVDKIQEGNLDKVESSNIKGDML